MAALTTGAAVAEGVARVRNGDPAFELEPFTVRARLAYHQLQAAWAGQDAERARPLLPQLRRLGDCHLG